MYYDEYSPTDCILSTLFTAGLCWFSHSMGRKSAFKEVDEEITRQEIKSLRSEINNFSGNKDKYDHWQDLRKKLKLPSSS